jgi:hypothetical protein
MTDITQVFLYREPAAGGGFSVLRDGIANNNRFALNTEEDLEKGDKLYLRIVTTTAGFPFSIETWTVSALNKDTGHLATGAGTSEMADDKARFLVPEYREISVSLASSGDFTAGTLLLTKIGRVVTVQSTGALSHSLSDNPVSSSGVIPADFRPQANAYNTYYSDTSSSKSLRIFTTGTVETIYQDDTAGVSGTTSTVPVTLTYTV